MLSDDVASCTRPAIAPPVWAARGPAARMSRDRAAIPHLIPRVYAPLLSIHWVSRSHRSVDPPTYASDRRRPQRGESGGGRNNAPCASGDSLPFEGSTTTIVPPLS